MVSLSERYYHSVRDKSEVWNAFFFCIAINLNVYFRFHHYGAGVCHPGKYQVELSKETTTAVRVTQLYAEATHTVGSGYRNYMLEY